MPTGVDKTLTWEENTERRVGILEQKMDKVLDPETGIYPKIAQSQNRLERWAMGIMAAALANLILPRLFG